MKKKVEQHHDWKQRNNKDTPGYAYKDGKEGNSGEFTKSVRNSNYNNGMRSKYEKC